jgi:type IV pilus assembly protein PilW
MRRLRGFSMVEMMVAIMLSLVVMVAVVSVFVGSRAAYQSTSGVAAVTDGGRFATNFIEESARNAGWFACNHADVNTSLDYLNWVASPLQFDFRYAIGGFEATNTAPGDAFVQPATQVAGAGTGNWKADPAIDPVTGTLEFTLDAEFTAATNNQVTNSDILVLRSSIPQVKPVYTTLDALTGAAILNVTGSTGFQVGQIAAVSDCTKSAAFQISAIAGGAPAVISFGGGIGPPGNAQASLTRPFVAGAVVQPLTTYVYYIGIGQDGDAALRRLDLNGANGPATFTDEELVPDVENMQVLYGVDTTGALSATEYVTADAVTDFGSVVSVQVALLAASPPQTGQALTPVPQVYNLLGTQITAPVDSRKRRVFTVTIALRNQLN